jgi:hypothetical protein
MGIKTYTMHFLLAMRGRQAEPPEARPVGRHVQTRPRVESGTSQSHASRIAMFSCATCGRT